MKNGEELQEELGLQRELLEDVHEVLLDYADPKESDFYDTAAFKISKFVLSPRIKVIKSKCNEKEYYVDKYLFPAIFTQKEESVISGKTLSNLYLAVEDGSLKPVSEQNNKNTWCFLAILLNYFGWKGYVDKLTIDEAILKFPNVEDTPEIDVLDTVDNALTMLVQGVLNEQEQIKEGHRNQHEFNEIRKKLLSIFDNSAKLRNSIVPKHLSLNTKEKALDSDLETIIRNDLSQEGLYAIVNPYLGSEGRKNWEWFDRSAIINALSISFILKYDESKAILLIRCINERLTNKEKVIDSEWQRALVGLILGLLTVYDDNQKIEIVKRQLQNISFAEDIKRGILLVIDEIIEPQMKESLISNALLETKYFMDGFNWLVPFHENSLPLRKAFQETNKNVNTAGFAKLLSTSLSLTTFEKLDIAFKYPFVEVKEINNIMNNLEVERYLINKVSSSYIDLEYQLFSNIYKEFIQIMNQISSRNQNFNTNTYDIRTISEKFALTLTETVNDFSISALFYYRKKDYIKAIKHYQKALEVNPDNFTVSYNLGIAFFRIGENEKAIKSFKKATEIKPDIYMTWCYLGIASFNLGLNEKAIESYQISIKIYPNSKSWHYKGLAYQNLGKLDGAIESFREAIEINPDYFEAWNDMGKVYLIMGKEELAIESFQKVIKINPDYFEGWYNMGAAMSKKGENEKAIESYQKVIVINPNYYEAWYNMGCIYSDLGENEKAINSFENAININSDDHEAWYNLGVVFSKQGENKKAIESYQRSINIKSNYYNSWYNMGGSLSNIGEKDEAFEALINASLINPNDLTIWNKIGLTYLQQGEFDYAIKYCNKAVKVNPDNFLAWNYIGIAYSYLGKDNEAIESNLRCIRIKPDHFDAWFNMGFALDKLGKKDKAIESYKRTTELNPKYYNAWYNMGSVFSDLKEYEKAIAAFKKAVEIKPNSDKAWLYLGKAYSEHGEMMKAYECVKKATEIQTNNNI